MAIATRGAEVSGDTQLAVVKVGDATLATRDPVGGHSLLWAHGNMVGQ